MEGTKRLAPRLPRLQGKEAMRLRTVVLTATILSASVSVGAKVTPPQPFFLDRDITMNGAAVPHGMYSLTVESKGSSVHATLWKDGHFVATAGGTWVKHGVKYGENQVLLKVNPDGTRVLTEIRLAGSTRTIVIIDTSSLSASPAATAQAKPSQVSLN
jgi:hypothetical protein